jgi:hypothetical protein
MHPILVTTLRWASRIAGSFVVLIVLLFAIGEGFPNPFTLALLEQLQLVSLLAMLVGILIAWRWEGIGGAMLVVGFVTFLAIESVHRHSLALFSFFDFFLLLGVLNIVVWWSAKHRPVKA